MSESKRERREEDDLTSSPARQEDGSQDSDLADVALAAEGDPQAFERLYHRHAARVYSLARRMTSDQEAEELTQDVFVRTWQKLHTFRGEAQFSSWLHRLAVNVIYGRQRTKSVRRGRLASDERALDRAATRIGGHGSPEIRIDFESAIRHLPDGAKQIFVLHDVEGYKHREIADMLEISEGTSKSQLHRARLILREHLYR